MGVMNNGGPFERLKDIWVELICTSMDEQRVQYKTASRLFHSWGTCRTLENLTALPLFVTEIPFVDESSEQELLSLLGDWYEPKTFESVFSYMSSNAVLFSSYSSFSPHFPQHSTLLLSHAIALYCGIRMFSTSYCGRYSPIGSSFLEPALILLWTLQQSSNHTIYIAPLTVLSLLLVLCNPALYLAHL